MDEFDEWWPTEDRWPVRGDFPPRSSFIPNEAPVPFIDSPEPLANLQSVWGTKKFDLPMIVNGSILISRPDSGSEDNIMVIDLANELELSVDAGAEHQKEFRMGNGKVIRALGKVMIDCAFAKEPNVRLRCIFYVFQRLVTPLILGMSFLDETETLSKNRHRLEPRSYVPRGLVDVCGLNSPRRRLFCIAESQPILANADTGSEVNLISLAYVQKRGFCIEPITTAPSMVQFADGSTSALLGVVSLSIVFGNLEGRRLNVVFHILEGLTCELLLGEDILNDNDVFRTYADAFSLEDNKENVFEINTIVWFRSVEEFLSKLKNLYSKGSTGSDIDALSHKSGSHHKDQSVMSLLDRLDARENARREQAEQEILKSPEADRDGAWDEENTKRELYKRNRSTLYHETLRVEPELDSRAVFELETPLGSGENALPNPSSIVSIRSDIYGEASGEERQRPRPNAFKCKYPRCNALSFLNQYLLNAHAKNHWRYICPFCRDSPRKFQQRRDIVRHVERFHRDAS